MSLDVTSLRKALGIQEKIDALTTELNALLGGGFSSSGTGKKRGRPAKGMSLDAEPTKKRKKRKLSPEALEKIREGQRKRWSKFKKEKAGK